MKEGQKVEVSRWEDLVKEQQNGRGCGNSGGSTEILGLGAEEKDA